MYEPVTVSDWQELAEQLLADLGDAVEQRGSPIWVKVLEGLYESDLLCVSDDDPAGLIGWTASPDCEAVGVVATGRARPIADTENRDAIERDFARIRLCCVVGRSGEVGWTLEGSSGDRRVEAPKEGRLLDAMMRCFGLPTPPPDVPAAELHGAAWLTAILEHAIQSAKPLTWSDVSRLHPLAQLLGGELLVRDDPSGADADDEITALIRIAANAWSWPEIRAQAREGNLEALIDPLLAAWMDDGMFSRWLLEQIPPLEQLLGAVEQYLVPSAAKRLASALR